MAQKNLGQNAAVQNLKICRRKKLFNVGLHLDNVVLNFTEF